MDSEGVSVSWLFEKDDFMSKELTKRELFRLQPVLLVWATNPKKNPSMSYDRFENYFTVHNAHGGGKDADYTVKDCLDAGVRMDDIQHDSKHGFILLGEEAIDAYRAENREMVEGDL
jgi:hypothetical protein